MDEYNITMPIGNNRGRDHMVDGFTTTCAINAYQR